MRSPQSIPFAKVVHYFEMTKKNVFFFSSKELNSIKKGETENT